ncbi:extracellular solute-binding protein [Candidatus Xianfuyuplasma coldseepsis]|uniref:Extracellular solute-binding protein n=1 Tax=Candidatus Xianfuyuplasma coldseepsis TaxID=2782163 RepID=A0A7L7KRF4_9MOLU|nr:extracellular solute-binding protein [Xianfuyuplasma coldseepsis]QMS84979.1 extracellular solute-binding protein [Xianfuyuplasma coldseepsis]
MKRVITLLAAFVLVFSLAGCLSAREDQGEIEVVVLDELPDEEITIKFWHIYGQEKGALLDEMIADFMEEYPNIVVEAESKSNYTNLLSVTKVAINKGTAPDVLVGYPDHFAEYLDLGGLIPLDKFVEHETWGVDLDDYIDSYVAENQQYADGMYSMPYSKSTEMMVYNKEFFDANGITFDDYEVLYWEDIAAMKDTMVGTGATQCEFLINYDSSANLFINSSRQWDAGYTNSDGEVLVDNANTRAMLTYFQGLIEDKVLALPLEWEESYGSTNFLQQDVCMTVGSTAGLKYNLPGVQLDEADYFEVGILPTPQFKDKTQSAMQQGPNIAIMENADNAERLASWLLIKHLTTAENTAAWAMETGYLPVTYSGFNSTLYQNLMNDPSPDYIYESMVANAAYTQLSYNNYDPAFAGVGLISSAKVREEAGYAMEKLYVSLKPEAEDKTIDQIISEMLAQLTW